MSQSRARRMQEQSWMYDRLIRFGGPDFYWPMTQEVLNASGMTGWGDVMSVRAGVRRMADLTREMRRIGDKRRALATQAAQHGHRETAAENYFVAAACYTLAQGPIHEDGNAENLALSACKNDAYAQYIRHADHHIEAVEVPFVMPGKGGKKIRTSLPAYLHFPPGVDVAALQREAKQNKQNKHNKPLPAMVYLGGMDNFKELLVTRPRDPFLDRGMVVLAIDGPGQNEALISRGIRVTESNFIDAGRAAMDYLISRPEIDAGRIGIAGISMGSFWLTQIVAHDHRYKAAAGYYICHENGMDTIFNRAIPMFKDRYMWMSGYTDEAKFDRFAKKLTLAGLGARIRCAYLSVAGEDDDLSPIQCTYDLHDAIKAPNTLVVYRGERHGITDNADVRADIADWMRDRLNGKLLKTKRIFKSCRTGLEVA